jgi:hypothetical protein
LLLQKRVRKTWILILPVWEELTKPQRYCYRLIQIRLFFFTDIYGEGNYPKTTLKRVKVLAITKQTTKLTKKELH